MFPFFYNKWCIILNTLRVKFRLKCAEYELVLKRTPDALTLAPDPTHLIVSFSTIDGNNVFDDRAFLTTIDDIKDPQYLKEYIEAFGRKLQSHLDFFLGYYCAMGLPIATLSTLDVTWRSGGAREVAYRYPIVSRVIVCDGK